MAFIFRKIIWLYGLLLSPFMGNQCRFHPTCSAYADQAFEKHGTFKGFYLTFARICNCHPYSKRCYKDNVPKRFAWRDALHYKSDE